MCWMLGVQHEPHCAMISHVLPPPFYPPLVCLTWVCRAWARSTAPCGLLGAQPKGAEESRISATLGEDLVLLIRLCPCGAAPLRLLAVCCCCFGRFCRFWCCCRLCIAYCFLSKGSAATAVAPIPHSLLRYGGITHAIAGSCFIHHLHHVLYHSSALNLFNLLIRVFNLKKFYPYH